jgi:hypothetical protein
MLNSVAPVKPAIVEAVEKYHVEPDLRSLRASHPVVTEAVELTRVDDVLEARVR